MKLRLLLATGTWEACWPMSGSESGWSPWEPYNRQGALSMIELGFEYEKVA